MVTEKRVTRCPVDTGCQEIEELKEENVRLWGAMSKMMSVKMWLSIQALLGAAYLALFSVSYGMNSGAIGRIEEARAERKVQVESLTNSQTNLLLGITQLQGLIESHSKDIQGLRKDVDEVDKEVKGIIKRGSRNPGGGK